MRMCNVVLSLCLVMPALAACDDQDTIADTRVQVDEDPLAEAVDAIAVGETQGRGGLPIDLLPLTTDQMESANLSGELACSFAVDDGGTLLSARADVLRDGPVRGVVNHNGHVEILGNGQAGGFNDLSDGISLTGESLTAVLVRGASEPTGNESTQHAATLRVERADGAERDYEGTLTCGP